MITLGITNIRPGSVNRGFETGRGRGVFDRWELRFTLRYRDGTVKQSTRVTILPRDVGPLKECLHDGIIYGLVGEGPAPFVARYFKEDVARGEIAPSEAGSVEAGLRDAAGSADSNKAPTGD